MFGRRAAAAALAAACLALVACGDDEDAAGGSSTGSGGAASTQGIRVAYASDLDANDVADQVGLEAAGAKVTKLTEDSQVVAGLNRGAIDVGNIDFTAAVNAALKDVPIKIIYPSQLKPEFVMISQEPLTTLESLKGKKLAFHEPGSLTEKLPKLLLDQEAPGVAKTIKFSALPESPRRAAAMVAGRIDATTVEELDLIEISKQKKFNVLGTWNDLEGQASSAFATVWVTSEKYYDGHKAELEALVKELQAGYTKTYEDKAAWLAQAKKTLPGLDEASLSKVYDSYTKNEMYPKAGAPALTAESYAEANAFFKDAGEWDTDAPKDLVDFDLVAAGAGS